jgi:hypothetical protein
VLVSALRRDRNRASVTIGVNGLNLPSESIKALEHPDFHKGVIVTQFCPRYSDLQLGVQLAPLPNSTRSDKDGETSQYWIKAKSILQRIPLPSEI